MQLTFENILTYENKKNMHLAHNPDNKLLSYYQDGLFLKAAGAYPPGGNYEDLAFIGEPNTMTSGPVKDFGLKSFPHIGAYGYYTPMYQPTSIVVYPLNKVQERTYAPSVEVSVDGLHISLEITANYECYRIILRKEYFAVEFITYDNNFEFDSPYTGECFLSVIGHSREISTTSTPWEQLITLTGELPPIPMYAPVYSVNNIMPDEEGNVSLDAEDIPVSVLGIQANNIRDAILELLEVAVNITLVAANWSSFQQTVSVPEVKADSKIILAPVPADQGLYTGANILCISKAEGSLTFQCDTIPLSDIQVGVIIL